MSILHKLFVLKRGPIKPKGQASLGELTRRIGLVQRLVEQKQLSVDIYHPLVAIDVELHLALRSKPKRYQGFLTNLIVYINAMRSSFNGAAAEGLAVAPDGRTSLPLLAEQDAVGCNVVVGDTVLAYGSFSMREFKFTVA